MRIRGIERGTNVVPIKSGQPDAPYDQALDIPLRGHRGRRGTALVAAGLLTVAVGARGVINRRADCEPISKAATAATVNAKPDTLCGILNNLPRGIWSNDVTLYRRK